MTGIYQILNVKTGDKYIGSAKSFKERWRRHRKDLRGQKHHSQYLQRAWNKYGSNAFLFQVIEECEYKDVPERENYYLKLERPVYNMCPEAYSQVGRKLSDNHVQKLRDYAAANNVRPPASTYEQRRKPVIQLDKNTLAELQEFPSLSDACRAIGKDHTFVSTLAGVCNGIRPSAYGYKWRYKQFPNENHTK